MRNTRTLMVIMLLACSLAFAQNQSTQSPPPKIVSIPEDQLTEQQKAALKLQTEQQKAALKLQQAGNIVETAHGWVGLGKELGQAFDSALASLSDRSNQFAGTKVGKFTMFLVAWKVMGEQAGQVLHAVVQITIGLVEMVIFLPIFLWSYRKNCMTRSILVTKEQGFFGKKTYEIKTYDKGDYKEFTPRHGHCVALGVFTIIWLATTFTY